MDKLGRCQYFSTLDLAIAFHQIEMDEEDIEKTVFNTENTLGIFENAFRPPLKKVTDNILRSIQSE